MSARKSQDDDVNDAQPVDKGVVNPADALAAAVSTSEGADTDSEQDSPRAHAQVEAAQTHVPYTVFTGWERWAIIIMASMASFASPLTGTIYYPAMPAMAAAFHQSLENINLTVTVYQIFQGLAPSLWGSIADRKGRRPSFIICLLILILSSVGIALTPTSAYWLLLVLRCVQAAGSASTIALSLGVVADTVPVQDRGGFVGVSQMGFLVGPCIAPVVGGVLVDKLGWRAIFWFIAILTGVMMIIMILFFPETARTQVGNGAIPAPRWNRPLIPIIRRGSSPPTAERPPPKPLPNPFRLFVCPDLMLLLLGTGTVYCLFYAVSATLSSLFTTAYPNLNTTEIGLCFLSIGGAGAIATILQGRVLDWQFRTVKRKWEERRKVDVEKRAVGEGRDGEGGDDGEGDGDGAHAHDDFPIEQATLQTQFIWILLMSAASVGYGWSIEKRASIAVPLVMQFIIGYTLIAILTNTQTLIVDLFPSQGSSATAANNLVRCLMGAIAVSIINIITDKIGPGWTYTLGGGLCLLTWPMIVVNLKMGPKWRRKRREKQRREEQLREEREREAKRG